MRDCKVGKKGAEQIRVETLRLGIGDWALGWSRRWIDPSMKITINVQQNSKIFAQFSSTHQLEPPESIWIRIVVDDNYNSSRYICSTGPPASGTYKMTGHIEFLTNSLNAGTHTINVQFLIESGSPDILDRTITVIEIASQ